MARLLKMPALGQTVEEVRILQWFKAEGDTVEKGEPLAEIETDKVNIAWESPEAGVVRRLLAPVDSFVKVEAPVVVIGTADESIDDVLPDAAPPAPTSGGANSPIFASPRARRYADEFGIALAQLAGRGTGPGKRVLEKDVVALHEEMQGAAAAAQTMAGRGPKASPLARAVAGSEGLDLAALSGSGAGGKITAGDVRQASPQALSSLEAGGTRTITLSGLRKRVADNIAKSVRTAPHVTLNLRANMTEAARLRADLLPAVEKATGVRLSPTDLIVKAAAKALTQFPYVNAHLSDDVLTLFDNVHVGLAVSLGEAGLIVPVIKNADTIGLAEIARARHDLAARARDNTLGGQDIANGTFTVTNLGAYGIESFNPIINPPQVAILGVGAIADEVVAQSGVPVVRSMMGLSLSFDHRAMDGAPAAAFLAYVKELLENPYLLLV